MPMKKHWTYTGNSDKKFDTYDDAVTAAKRKVGNRPSYYSGDDTLYILEAVAGVEIPVPEMTVTKLQ